MTLSLHSALTAAPSRPVDSAQFLEDAVGAAKYGWNQYRARRTTFDELLGSGKLGLIRSADLRTSIGDYYKSDAAISERIDERETAFPDISYQLVPRSNESKLDPALDSAQIELLVTSAFESPLREHVIAEINFAQFVDARFVELQTMCSELIVALQAYLDAKR